MATQNICNICGAEYEYRDGRWRCPACGAYKPEEISNEEETLLYNAAQKLRLGAFDDAEELYRDITRQYPKNSRGYWGLVLAKYGIIYERDYDGKMVPSCYATKYESISGDDNYKKALQYADSDNKKYYLTQANLIEEVRRKWIEIAEREEPYDVFISYKDSDKENNIERTQDSFDAYELYVFLKDRGYRVFFSRESLRGKEGDKYEPYIFNALNTAQVMIVYGSKPEYIESTWVKNEWMRYYKRIRHGDKQDNSLILAYKGFNPSKLPKPLCDIQGVDLGRAAIGFGDIEAKVSEILINAKKRQKMVRRTVKVRREQTSEKLQKIETKEIGRVAVVPKAERERVAVRAIGAKTLKLSASAENTLNVAQGYLERGDFAEAAERFKSVLVSSPRNGRALTGVLLAGSVSVSIDAFVNGGAANLSDMSLLEKVLGCAEKDVAEKILQAVCRDVERSLSAGDVMRAKQIVAVIREYDDVSVDKMRRGLFDAGLKLLPSDEHSARYFIDINLDFEEDNRTYIKKLHTAVSRAISCGKFDTAKYWLDVLKNTDPASFDTQVCLIEAEYKVKSADEVLNRIESEKAYSRAEDIIALLDRPSAEKWLGICLDEASYLIDSERFGGAQRWIEMCAKYNFESREAKLKELLEKCIKRASEKSAECFESLLTYVADGNDTVYVKNALEFAASARSGGNFSCAKIYYGKALAVWPDCIPAARGRFYADIGCADEQQLPEKIGNISDWTCFEDVLAVQKDDADDLFWIKKLAKACIDNVKEYKLSAAKKIFEVFEKLLSYIPEKSESDMLVLLGNMADLCLSEGLFDEAGRFYSMYIGEDSECSAAYWGLLSAKLKCRNEEELVKQPKPLSEFEEFENAQLCAAGNKPLLNHYMDVREKQTAHIKKAKRRSRAIKISAIALSAAVVAGGAVGGFLAYYNSQSGLVYSENNGGYVVSAGKFYNAGERLVIPEEYNGKPVIAIGKDGFAEYTEIEELVLSDNIVRIEEGAFAECSNLTEVTISSSNVRAAQEYYSEGGNLEYIGGRAFEGCSSLAAFSFEYGLEYVGTRAFSDAAFVQVSLPCTVSFVGSEAFYNCKNLAEIVVSDREEIPSGWAENWNAGCNASVDFRLRVVLDYNGATSGTTVGEEYISYGKDFVLPVPERKGYSFGGWYSGDTRLTDGFGKGISAWQSQSGGILTAKWSANINTLNFNANGGEGTMSAQEIVTDETASISANTFTRKGYTFVGWAESANGGVVYKDCAEYTMGAESSYELFAVWVANRNEVVFDGNGATGGSMESQFISTDSSASLTENTFTKTGYTFAGWATSAGGEVVYADGANYAMGTAVQYTLYAVWEATEYSIRYYTNGGIAEGNPSVYTIEDDDIVLNIPARAGYRFAGWTGTGLSEPTLTVIIEMGSTGNREYTANWEANENNIVFNANGGKGEMTAQSIKTDETAPLFLNSFARDGYRFAGWATSADGEVEYSDCANYTMGAESEYTLYAVWEVVSYSISYQLNGGVAEGNPDLYTIESQSFTLYAPVRAGYTFAGWTGTDIESATQFVTVTQGSWGDRKFAATWTANRNSIIFDPNGGVGEMPEQVIATDSSEHLVANLFTRAGYTFAGWATSPEGDVVYADCADYLMGTEEQYTLYAIWLPNLNTIIFDGNDADGGEMEYVSAHTNEVIMLPENTFERIGHTFVGWATEPGGGVIYEDEAEYTMGAAASYTLYAVWQINQYTITIESNGDTEIAPITQDYGTVVQAPAVTRTGYAFVEWYSDNDFTEVFNFATMPAENITVYAKWQLNNFNGEYAGIRNVEEFLLIKENLNGNYILMNDINLGDWGNRINGFNGEFDGNGMTVTITSGGIFNKVDGNIRNLNVIINADSGTWGAIAITSNGIIENCHVEGTISRHERGEAYVGAITQTANDVINCSANIELNVTAVEDLNRRGIARIGGLVCTLNGEMRNCYITGTIGYETRDSNNCASVGGLVYTNNGTIESCYSDVVIYARGTVAGLVAVNNSGGIIQNSYANVNIRAYTWHGDYSWNTNDATVGGLVCTNYGDLRNSFAIIESMVVNGSKGDIYYNGVEPVNCLSHGSGEVTDYKSYVNELGWDTDLWVFGYDIPLLYEADKYIRVNYVMGYETLNSNNPDAYLIGSAGFILNDPIREGYTFGGWYTDDNFENEITEITSLSEPLTIYAKWTPNSYTITLNPVGGDLETDSVQVDYDGEYQLSVPTLFGYKFVGWYDGTGQTAVAYTDEEGRSLAPWTDTRGLTLYAKWQQIRFTLSLEYEGADANFDTESLEVWTGEEYTLPVPSRENYVFGGWYSAPGGGGTKYADEEGNGIGVWSYDGDITLYAYWLGTDGLAYTLNEGGTYTLTGLTDTSLTEIYIPEYFDGKPVTEIAENAFASGSDITEIFVPASISAIGKGAFAGCTALQSLAVPFIGNARGAEGEAALLGWLFSDTPMSGCTLVYQYYSEYGMSAAHIPDSLTEVTVTDAENIGYGAFSSVTSLQSVSITANALGERVFYDCASLAEVELCSGITAIGQSAFARCVALQEIAIPASVQTVGRYVFDECAALTSLTLPYIGANAQASGAEGALGYLFGSVTSADMVLVNQSSVTAYFPARLANLTITSATQIAANALRGLTMLKSIAWNDGITSIGDYALYGCTGVTVLTLPASLQTVGNYAFYNVKISVLELPQSVVSLGTYALYGSGLRTLLVPSSSVVSLGDRALDSTHTALKIYVTDSLLNSYKSVWSAYSSRIYSFNCIRENGMAIDGTVFLQYFGEETVLALPSNITEIGAYAFAGTNVCSVLVPGNVRTIGLYAFSGCDTLESVRLLSGVRTISANAFYGAAGLTEVEIPNTVTEIGANAFYGCSSLVNVVVPEGVTSIEVGSFYGCSSLKEVVIPNSVTSIASGVFQGCNSLVKMTLPFVGGSRNTTSSTPTTSSSNIWDGGSRYLFGYIFGGERDTVYGGSASNSIVYSGTVPDGTVYQGEKTYVSSYWSGNVQRYRHYINLYYIPSTLREVIITDATGISANSFYNCIMLTSITLNEGIKSIYMNAFYNCSGLLEIIIPESVTSIDAYAFANSSNLTKVMLPNGLTSLSDYIFQNCISLTSVNENGKIIIGGSVKNIGAYAFTGCTSIKNVILLNGVIKIDVSAFNGATNLTQIAIPASVTSIGDNAFYNCINLIRINGEDDGKIILQEGLVSIGTSSFYNLEKITELVVPNSVTSIGYGAFQGCNSLIKVVLPFVGASREANSYEAVFGYIFGYSVTAYDEYNGSNVGTLSSEKYRTSKDSSYANIKIDAIENTVWQYSCYDKSGKYGRRWVDGTSGFAGYYSDLYGCLLQSYHYYIPITITEVMITDAKKIEQAAFNNCSMLTRIILNNEIESLGQYSFNNCSNLVEMVIPDSVTSIGNCAFQKCSLLQTVQILRGDVLSLTSLGSNVFDSTPATLLILVPDDAYSAYIAAANWSVYANKIRPISAAQDGFIVEDGVLLHYIGTAETVTIPAGVTSIGDYAFAHNYTLKQLIIGNDVVTIGDYAFYQCLSLQSVVIGDSVQTIESFAFDQCISLQSVVIGEGIQTIARYAFYGCASLQSVAYGSNLQSIGEYAFADCPALFMINSENPNTFCIGDSVTSIGVGAFMGCNSLSSIVLPFVGADGTATAGYMQVFGYIFGYTTSNTAGTVEQVSGYYYYIPASLTNVVITQETSLAENAFTGCANITSIELSAVQSIADYAFYGCDGLVSLTIRAQTMPALSATAFNGGKTVTVYVLAELVGQYQADGQWNKHSILAIS